MKIMHHAWAYAVAELLTKATITCVLPILAIVLTAAEVVRYSIFISSIQLLLPALCLGGNVLAAKAGADSSQAGLLKAVHFWSFGSILVMMIIVASALILHMSGAEISMTVVAYIVSAQMASLALLVSSYLNITGRVREFILLFNGSRVLLALVPLSLCALVLFKVQIAELHIAVGSMLIITAFTLKKCGQYVQRLRLAVVLNVSEYRYVLPSIVTAISAFSFQVFPRGTVLVEFGDSAAASVALGQSFFGAFGLIFAVISRVVAPKIFRLAHNKQDALDLSLHYFFTLLLPIVLLGGVVVAGIFVVWPILGSEDILAEDVVLASVIVFSLATTNLLYSLSTDVNVAKGRGWINSVALVVLFLGLVYLVPLVHQYETTAEILIAFTVFQSTFHCVIWCTAFPNRRALGPMMLALLFPLGASVYGIGYD